jgi:hypothetical protein
LEKNENEKLIGLVTLAGDPLDLVCQGMEEQDSYAEKKKTNKI